MINLTGIIRLHHKRRGSLTSSHVQDSKDQSFSFENVKLKLSFDQNWKGNFVGFFTLESLTNFQQPYKLKA